MKKIFNLFILTLMVFCVSSCNNNVYKYEDYEKFISSSNFTLEDCIDSIEISWICGNVIIVQGESSNIVVKEENYENYPLFYYLDGKTLKIEFVEYGTKEKLFNSLNKDLTISIPFSQSGMQDIDIHIVNGNCNFSTINYFGNVEVELVNGDIHIFNIAGNEIDLKVINGNITIDSIAADSLFIDKVNGNSSINNIGKPLNINIKSVNGIDTIYVFEGFGYKVELNTFAKFTSEYNDLLTYSSELVVIDYDAVNGSLTIKK